MSQFYQGVTAGSLPPTVPTSFIADDSSVAVPVDNLLNVVGGPGIQTYVSPDGSDNFYISLKNGCSDSAQTVGAVSANIICLSMGATPGTMLVNTKVSAFSISGGSLSAGYEINACVRTDGVSATVIGVPDKLVFEEGALSAANATIGVSGNNVIITVTGVAGHTINWVEASSGNFAS